jgi:hypothetical protein
MSTAQQLAATLAHDADALRRDFLRRLDLAHWLPLSPWELQFTQDLLANPRPFTHEQRQAIDLLAAKHQL